MSVITVLTIFPSIIDSYCSQGVIGRACARDLVTVRSVDLREYTSDVHRSVDDAPFGGGAGMLMRPEPVFRAVEDLDPVGPLIYVAPFGRPFSQKKAQELASLPEGFTILCGRYEGIDARVEETLVDEVISVGDYVLTGGELAALCIIDAAVRLLPHVLGNEQSLRSESFENGLLEHPQYTRPSRYRSLDVPDVLLSGHHGEIDRWKRRQSVLRTARYRPDLLASASLSSEDVDLLFENGYAYVVNEVAGSTEADAGH
ncbi:MAG: tRNA (guanosine(37)-N1)-methyltransferase TrmD [Acidimicrobiales bacterium]